MWIEQEPLTEELPSADSMGGRPHGLIQALPAINPVSRGANPCSVRNHMAALAMPRSADIACA